MCTPSALGALQVIFDAPDPTTNLLPAPWSSQLDSFQCLALLRCLRPDRCGVRVCGGEGEGHASC